MIIAKEAKPLLPTLIDCLLHMFIHDILKFTNKKKKNPAKMTRIRNRQTYGFVRAQKCNVSNTVIAGSRLTKFYQNNRILFFPIYHTFMSDAINSRFRFWAERNIYWFNYGALFFFSIITFSNENSCSGHLIRFLQW